MSRRFKTLFGAFAVATFSALIVRLFLIEDYRISSDSMSPNLLAGDLVFVSKYDFNLRIPFSSYEIFSFRRPEKGEVVAFTLPDRGMATFVKRVVASEGDKILIQNGILWVNGVAAQYAPLPDPLGTDPLALGWRWEERWEGGSAYSVQWNRKIEKEYGPIDIPKGHFFALGDNRSDSMDSRSWGPVPYSCLKGRIGIVWLSVNSEGKLRKERSTLR